MIAAILAFLSSIASLQRGAGQTLPPRDEVAAQSNYIAFFAIQSVLASQRRSIDALDGVLATIAVIAVAVMLETLKKANADPTGLDEATALLLLLPTFLALAALISPSMEACEAPDAATFLALIREDPNRALSEGVEAMCWAFDRNQVSIQNKRYLRNLSMGLLIAIIASIAAAPAVSQYVWHGIIR